MFWHIFHLYLFIYLLIRRDLNELLILNNEFSHFLELFVLSFFGISPLLIGLIYEKTIIQKILSLKFMVILGKSSYIFYLIHKGFIPIFIDEYITSNKLLLFIILNILSYFMFVYMEEPLNNYIKNTYKLYKRKKHLN